MNASSRRFALIPAMAVVVALVLSGCADEDIGKLTVFADPTEGDAPLEVEFVVRAGADQSGFTYAWRFGDGSTSDLAEPAHTYSEPGVYKVWVEVTSPGGSTDEATETVTVTGEASEPGEGDGTAQPDDEPADDTYETWRQAVNDACAASTSAAAQVQGDPNSPEALARFVEINNAETEAIAAAGVPTENAAEAQEWIDLRTQGSELFVDMATNPPTSADDPRIAQLDQIALELAALSAARGLDACAGE